MAEMPFASREHNLGQIASGPEGLVGFVAEVPEGERVDSGQEMKST